MSGVLAKCRYLCALQTIHTGTIHRKIMLVNFGEEILGIPTKFVYAL